MAGKTHHLEAHFNNYQEHCLLSPYYLPGTVLSAFVILESSVSLKGVTQCGQEPGGPAWLVPWTVRLERQRLWVVSFAWLKVVLREGNSVLLQRQELYPEGAVSRESSWLGLGERERERERPVPQLEPFCAGLPGEKPLPVARSRDSVHSSIRTEMRLADPKFPLTF